MSRKLSKKGTKARGHKGTKGKPGRPRKSSPKSEAIGSVHGNALKPHPLALLLPPMSEADYLALKSDIAQNGQQEKGTLYEGKILDGRHRARACAELNKPFAAVDFKGTPEEALNLVYSKAVHRHLSESQKACAAVHFDLKFSETAKARSLANLKGQGKAGNQIVGVGDVLSIDNRTMFVESFEGSPGEEIVNLKPVYADGKNQKGFALSLDDCKRLLDNPLSLVDKPLMKVGPMRSRDRAAGLFGVSGRYVQTAKLLLNHDKKLFEEVFNGTQTLSRAARAIHRAKKGSDLEKRAEGVELSFPLGLIHGDCIEEMEKMKAGSFRLAIADPPYNIGIDYGRGAKADSLSEDKYQDWCQKWMSELYRVLAKDGSLWVLINDEHAAMFDIELHSAGFHRRAWIKWYETFGVNCTKNFNRTSRHLFYCVKDANDFTFHASAFNRPSDRQKKYGDSRANPAGKCWDDVWIDIPRLVDNSKERVPGFPTQLPLALILPIIHGCSDKGDSIIDPFNGSGTTAHAGMLAGRIPTTIDNVKRNIEWTELRLKAAIAEAPAIADEQARATRATKSQRSAS